MTQSDSPIAAQAYLLHQTFLGLQLLVAVEQEKADVYEWMFRLFRRQHEEKFLSSFAKLGLEGEPPAVACAKYHVLSNNVGGVGVEYMEESERKAWVRFRYPRWMYAGPAICGIPVEASRGFLHGWYAQNGVSLNNPRLGFVCVSEDVTGQFGLCGYFQEYDQDLAPEDRLRFAPGERPPPFDPAAQPAPPPADWNAERLEKAQRNYALEYLRNGLPALAEVLGWERTRALATRAARLTGLQQRAALEAKLGCSGEGPDATAFLLAMLLRGMGDDVQRSEGAQQSIVLEQQGLRMVRGLEGSVREALLELATALWSGVVDSGRTFLSFEAKVEETRATFCLAPA